MNVTRIPFKLRAFDGEVVVEYGVNKDPAYWGFGEAVLGVDFPPEMALGFPVMQASVSYDGSGYGAYMGWIQVVRYQLHDPVEEVTVFDVAPQIKDSDVPFGSFGIRPTFFDAPGFSEKKEVTWNADSFLVHTPDGVLSREISVLTGFKWGYRIRNGLVEPFPVSVAAAPDWNRNLGDLRKRYPTWEFGNRWPK